MIQLLALASPNPDPMHPEPENQLVQRASSGCDEAYATLIAQNVTLVRSILGGYLRDDNEVDEIAQRVFIAAYQSLAEFRGDSKFSSWIVGIARRQVANYLRSEKRRRTHETKAAEVLIANWMEHSVDKRSNGNEKLSALTHCLNRLPENARTIVQRFYFQRDPISVIAADSKRSAGAIRNSLMRIRQSLSQCVSGTLASSIEGPKK